QLHHARRGVDLTVDGGNLVGRDLLYVGAVEGGDLQRRAGGELRHDVGKIVLGYREDHRDRLQLRDDRDAAGARGLHVIARIDQAQPDAAGHRRDDVAIGDVERLRVDLRLIDLYRSLVLLDQKGLILGL